MISKFRDITLLGIDDKNLLTVACDSAGGIGNKENDVIKVDPYITGYYTACVSLAETIAIGAEPITVINTLSVEMNDTGKRIIMGIKDALNQVGLNNESLVTGSTEENIPVTVTGLGLTIIGKVNTDSWKLPKPKSGNAAIVVGIPKVGDKVVNDKGEIINLDILMKLKKLDYIEDILPVGSKGIRYEAWEMAKTGNKQFIESEEIAVDMDISAGPATCAIVAVDDKYLGDIQKVINVPINVIGKFVEIKN